MRQGTLVGIAMMLAACSQSPSAPDATKLREATTADDYTCTESVAEYCARSGACPVFDEAVARSRALCTQPGTQGVGVATCEGVFRSVRWRYFVLGGGDQYFDASGRLTAAYLFSDYASAYCGHSFSQRIGDIPECPGELVTTSLCGP